MNLVLGFLILILSNFCNGQAAIANTVLNFISNFGNSTALQVPSSDWMLLYSKYNEAQKILKELSKKNSMCFKQIVSVIEAIQKNELWAVQMLDASAKLPSGILYGNIISLGNYEECIEIQQFDGEVQTEIRGQYCSTLVTEGKTRINSNTLEDNLIEAAEQFDFSSVRMTFGLCVPAACSARDLQNITDSIFPESAPFRFTFLDEFCSSRDKERKLPTRSIIGIIVFSSFGMLLLLGTVIDILDPTDNNAILRCFSMYTNGKKLFNSKTSENSLLCLNGLRVLSMMLIILGHRFIMMDGMPAVNKISMERWKESWFNYIFIGLGFAVDTFFTISGLLVVYLFMKAYEMGHPIHWTMFYIHRLLRLTPSLLMTVLFYITMVNFLEHEPFAILDDFLGQPCRDYWWSTILYIQNYWNPNNMCAVHTWYLAVDTQLYILSPILLIALTKFPGKTIACMVILTLLSICLAFGVTWEKQLGATYLNQESEEYKYLYTPTHIRVTPWLLGAITGYFIAEYKNNPFKFNKVLVYFLWILSVGSLLLVLLAQKFYHDNDYNVWYAALYNSLARPLWGAAVCIIIMICVTGHGGIINSFLSCSLFNVLIRINYAVYLVHMMVSAAIIAKIRVPVFMSNLNVIHEALGDYFIVLLIAILWTLAFESPIIALEKIFFSKGERSQDKNDSNLSKGSCETIVVE